MTDRLEHEIRRLAASAVEAAEAHGRQAEIARPGSPVEHGSSTRRYLAVGCVAALLLGCIAVGLLAHDRPSRLDTTANTDPTSGPPCPDDPSAPPPTDRPATSSEGVAVTALLIQTVPGYEVAWARQSCGQIRVTAMKNSRSGPSEGDISVIYAYGPPDQPWAADARLNGLTRVLSQLPDGVIGASSSSPDGPPRYLVIGQVVPTGQPPLFVEIAVSGTPPAGLTDDAVQALAVEILTTVAPPGA